MDTIGIAIKRDADVGAVRDYGALAGPGRRGAAVGVDVEAVRRNPDRDHLGAKLPQHLRCDAIGGAVGAIEHDPQTAEAQMARERRLGELHIALGAAVDALGAPDVVWRGQRGDPCHQRLDFSLLGIRELETVRAEQLDPVILIGIVRGRDHHAHVGAQRARQHPDRRRRRRAEQKDVHPRRGESRLQRAFDHVARQSRVLADDGAMAVRAAQKMPPRRLREPQGDIGGHRVAVGATANAVRSKNTARHGSLFCHRHRLYHARVR